MLTPLRVGVVGCGVIAPAHLESYRRLENVEITWACDLVAEKAAKLAQDYEIPQTTADYRDLLAAADVDAISVCTDHASHAPITAEALAAGKHVLCEKALAATAEGLQTMLEAHRRHPEPVFACVFQHRFDSVYRYIKKLIEEGALGTLLTAGVQVRCLRTDEYYQADRWRGTWAEEGGAVLINQAIHFIDSLVWIMGGVETLSGFYTNRTHAESMETEDTATAALTFRSGALGTIEATCSSHLGWENTLSFHGTEGALDVRQGESLKVAFADEALQERVTAELAACRDEKQVEAGKSYYGPSHPSQIRDFVESIREGRAPHVTPASASHTVEVVLGIYRSHREGRRVRLPSPGQTSA